MLLGATVQLDGSASSDLEGAITGYKWALIVKPANSNASISSAGAINPTFLADVGGVYVAQLAVVDNWMYSEPNTVVIQTLNRGPIADAGPDQAVLTGATVTLDGAGSTDPDGDALSYSWTLTAKPLGSKTTIIGATTASSTFVPDFDGVYTAALTVSDGEFTSTDSVSVTASNQPPVLAAIGPQTVDLGSTLTIQLTATDANPGTTLAFAAQPLPLPAGASLNGTTGAFTFKPDETQVGTIALTFSVTDGLLTDSESVSITVNGAPVGGATAISGRILDTNVFVVDGTELPVQGATVSVLNAPTITAVSDANGTFTLSGVPSGSQVFDIDTSTVVNAPVGVTYAGFREELTLIADVTNSIDRPLYLPRIEAESLTAINPLGETLVENTALGIKMTVGFEAAQNPDGSLFLGDLSISEVPLALAPASLPDLLEPGLLVTIQPVGVTFSPPAKITFPNIDNLPVGKIANLWSLDAASGAFAITGASQVSTDGLRLEWVSGGIRAADWHAVLPPPPVDTSEEDPEKEEDCGCDAPSGSATSLHTGNLKETHSLVGYSSAGQSHSLEFVYHSNSADPRPVITTNVTIPANILNAMPESISTRLSLNGVDQNFEQFTSTAGLRINNTESVRLAVQVDANDLETGLYAFQMTLMSNFTASGTGISRAGTVRVNNERNSPLGAGWMLAGLSRLTFSGGVALLTGGDGGISQYPVAPGSFEPVAEYGSIKFQAGRHEVADFNGDGIPDIAWGDLDLPFALTDTFVHILLGDGSGGFHTQLTTNVWPNQVPVDGFVAIPSAVYSGDFNKDDRLDLVTVSTSSGGRANDRISVQLGNGDGTFQTPQVLAVGSGPDAAIADFNGDLNLDIASVDFITGVRIFFGDGTGSFLPAEGLASTVVGTSRTLTVADFNKDGAPDLITEGNDAVVVRLNDGFGGFAVAATYPTGPLQPNPFTERLAIADFNNDGFVDIAASNPSERTISTLLNDGTGGFLLRIIHNSLFFGVDAIAAADFNQDGSQDIAIGRGGSSTGGIISILQGTGSGSFVSSQDIVMVAGRPGMPIRTNDVNRDGRPDIVSTARSEQTFDGLAHVNVALSVPVGETAYISPDSDYSKLIRNADGTFTRTLRSGTKYQFNAAGYQTAVTDLIGRTTSYQYDLSNRIKTITDAANLVTTFNYVGDRLDNIVDPANRVTQFRHDTAGNLVEITDPDLSARQFDYDPEHRLVLQIDKRGFRKTYEYDSFGRHARTVWPDGTERLMTAVQTAGLPDIAAGFGTGLNPAPVVRPTEADGTFRDGNNNQEIRKTNRFGFITERRLGVLNEGTPEETEERTIITDRDANNLVTRIVEPERTTTMTYYPNGLVQTRTVTDTTTHIDPYVTAGQARTWTYTYNALNKVETVDGPRTDVVDITSFEYDPVTGNLLKTTNALGHVTEITGYNAFGQPLGARDANSVETTLVYYPEGWLQTVTVDSGPGGTPATTGFTYDGAGNMKSTTLPDGSTLAYEYDGMGRMKAIQNGAGERMEYTYDDAGNREKTEVLAAPTTVGVPGDIVRTSSAVFDNLNRLLKSLGAYVGEEARYDYDGNGNVFRVTDPLGNATQTAFDALNRVIEVIEPAIAGVSGFVTYTYDAAGNMETATDQRGLVTSYIHNGFGEVIERTSPDTGATEYRYDSAGNRTQRTDARAAITNWTYDVLGRTLTMEFPPSTAFPDSAAENVTYSYDDPAAGNHGIGRLASVTDDSGGTSYVYDARGNIVRETRVIETPGLLAQTYVTEYGYDPADRLASMTYPSGRIVEYGRDTLGRVITVTTRENELATPVTLALAGTYEPFGGLDGLIYGNDVTLALGYDLNGRMETMDALGTTAILDLDYGFDLAGNIKTITDAGNGTRGREYSYDNLYRLTQARELASDGVTVSLQSDYDYDAVGNRTERIFGATPETSTTEIYDYSAFSNQLDTVTTGAIVRGLTYGGSGNTATDDKGDGAAALTFGYDATDRMTAVTQGTATLGAYLHNAAGQRVSKTVAGVTTHYLYSGGNIIGETDAATGATQAEYVWLGGMPLAFIASGTVHAVHADHLGTPQRLTDATGAVAWDASYRPFGEADIAVSSSVTFNLRFPGQYFDAENGLHYNYFRDYDTTIGRYIQSDPIGLSGGWNTYGYVGGNPVMRVDPTGEFAPPPVVAAAVEATLNLLGITIVMTSDGPDFDIPLDLDDDGNECKNQSCKNTYPDYILCTSLYEYYEFISVRQAANSFYGRNAIPGKGKPSNRGPQKCQEMAGGHWNVYLRGEFQGSITSCTCCDDSKFGEPELKTKYRAH